MLTILSARELQTLQGHIDGITSLLQHAQTVHLDASAPIKTKATEVSLPALPKSRGKTRGSSRKRRQALTARKVAEIKRLLQDGKMSAAQIARLYKVHLTTVYSIKWGKTWQQVAATKDLPKLEIVEIRK